MGHQSKRGLLAIAGMILGFLLLVFKEYTGSTPPGTPPMAPRDAKRSKPLDGNRRPHELSSEDCLHGELQLSRMLNDRPGMKFIDVSHSEIRDWVIRKFAGAGPLFRIHWNPAEPEDGFDSDSRIPTPTEDGWIRIKTQLDVEEAWHCAVFELINANKYKQFSVLYGRAISGRINKEDWIRSNTRLEYQTLMDAADFYSEIWVPSTHSTSLKSRQIWGCDSPPSYEEWIGGFRDPSGYPWNCWGKWFDELLKRRP